MRSILRVLERIYGRPMWKRWGSGVAVLVDTILSPNTSAANSSSGYEPLYGILREN